MKRKDLKYVNDVCPLFTPGVLPPYDATHWAGLGQIDPGYATLNERGFTTVVMKNPLISWHRTFTTDNNPLHSDSPAHPGRGKGGGLSLIRIEEWVPAFLGGSVTHGFKAFGPPRLHGIAEILAEGPVTANWRTQAKRHLRTFQKQSNVTLRLGLLDEIKSAYFHSSVPRSMRSTFWTLAERHLKEHPETIDVMIAESREHGIVAGFVAGECREASQSFYILGFYLPQAKQSQAMTGLVNLWFERSREKQLALCNFGDMCGPNPLPFQSDIGYSLFKTRFGIRRVWYPGSHWKIRFGKRKTA
ncbi:MAG: hypothetical protein WC802_00625 [Patescibacteria group bacterium]|jgi:hypothetical protein